MARIVDETQVEKIIHFLNKNGVIIFPTETVFGMAVKLDSYAGWLKMIDIKKRPTEKMFPIMVNSISMAEQYAILSPLTKRILEKFSPGPITIIAKPRRNIPRFFINESKTIALRIPDSELVIDIISRLNYPLIVTSANISGQPTTTEIDEIVKQFNKSVDIIVTGNCSLNEASTIIDATSNKIKIIREGSISLKQIEKELK